MVQGIDFQEVEAAEKRLGKLGKGVRILSPRLVGGIGRYSLAQQFIYDSISIKNQNSEIIYEYF